MLKKAKTSTTIIMITFLFIFRNGWLMGRFLFIMLLP